MEQFSVAAGFYSGAVVTIAFLLVGAIVYGRAKDWGATLKTWWLLMQRAKDFSVQTPEVRPPDEESPIEHVQGVLCRLKRGHTAWVQLNRVAVHLDATQQDQVGVTIQVQDKSSGQWVAGETTTLLQSPNGDVTRI